MSGVLNSEFDLPPQEFQDYLIYSDPSSPLDLTLNSNIPNIPYIPTKQPRMQSQTQTQVQINDPEIPQRSPNRRPCHVKPFLETISSPGSVSDSSFTERDVSSSSDESVFSDTETANDNDFDIENDDMSEIFEEIEKKKGKIIFEIDSVVSIVEIHRPIGPVSVSSRKTLSYVKC